MIVLVNSENPQEQREFETLSEVEVFFDSVEKPHEWVCPEGVGSVALE